MLNAPVHLVFCMSLQQRIDSDLKDAMRAKDTTKLGVLRMLKSALKYAAIEKSGADAELGRCGVNPGDSQTGEATAGFD